MNEQYLGVGGRMVTVGGKAVKMPQSVGGRDGVTFTPSVSEDGDLSWTNDGGLANPQTVNLKGPKGDTGAKGEPGEKGADGAPGKDGAKGDKGDTGLQGPMGPQGPKGDKGETGGKGAAGKDGTTPHIGPNGNWYIGNTDTGVSAGGTSHIFKVIVSDGPGGPDTLSANKTFAEIKSAHSSGSMVVVEQGLSLYELTYMGNTKIEFTHVNETYCDVLSCTNSGAPQEADGWLLNRTKRINYNTKYGDIGQKTVPVAIKELQEQSGGVYSALNNKLDKTGDGSNVTAAFTAATTRANIATGEKLSVLFGKIAKWFADLGSLAFKSTVSKSDLASDVQTSLGKADSAFADKVSKSGDTMTGKLTVPQVETGDGNSNFFQCRKFRGEGDANTYYHAIDFGYKNHDQVDFHEYGGKWNFYKNQSGKVNEGVLCGSITGNGWEGRAKLKSGSTMVTSQLTENSDAIATTAFVHGLVDTVNVPTVPSTTSLLKGDGSGGLVAASRGSDYIASGNIVKQTLVATETTPTENYAINWVYG